MNWRQFIALIRLRLQISKNQRIKAGLVNVILSSIITAGFVIATISSFLAGLIGGFFWLRSISPNSIYITWTALIAIFLGAWLVDLISKVQQSELISIEKLLHLPVLLKGAFFLNYTSSFANFIFVFFAPTMIGLATGMTIGRGMENLISIALVISFLFFVTALTYQVRGWLGKVMKNKRTQGIVLAVVPLFFVVIALGSMYAEFSFDDLDLDHTAHYLPPAGWVPFDIIQADNGNWLPGLISSIVMTCFGIASLCFAYNASIRTTTGADSRPSRRNRAKQRPTWKGSLQFSKLPFTSEPASAVAYFGLKSMLRSPEALMALLPLVALLIFGSPYLLGVGDFNIPDYIRHSLPLSVVFVTMIGFPAFLFSSFSYERDGFRSYILSPVSRKDVLVGKNLAVAAPTIASGWFLLVLMQLFIPQDSVSFLSCLIQVPATFLLMCVLGNAISIFFPIGLRRGSMQPVNAPVIPTIMVYLGVIIGPAVLLTPMSLASGLPMLIKFFTGTSVIWLYLLLSVIQLLLSWLVYVRSLGYLENWLWDREPEILDVVANIPE